MSKDIKQVIVMRKDLNMRKGKMVAQGAHASMMVFFNFLKKQTTDGDNLIYEMCIPGSDVGRDICTWIDGIFKKITCGINSEEELLETYKTAEEKGLPCSIVRDAGLTEFGGIPTYTCCAIGPARAEHIDEITGNLKLL